jgi:hypothetical protein
MMHFSAGRIKTSQTDGPGGVPEKSMVKGEDIVSFVMDKP